MKPFTSLRNHGETWPSLRVTLHAFPWNWRLRIIRDVEEGSMDEPDPLDRVAGWWGFTAQLGPLEVDYGHNRPAFTFERGAGVAG